MFLTPRWIASHLFAATLIVAFVFAGLWQVNRMQQRQDANALVLERQTALPITMDDVAANTPDELEYVRVQFTGTWDDERRILVANRSNEGTPGFWDWSVLQLDDGGDIVVNRGFVSRSIVVGNDPENTLDSLRPVAGPVIVEGLLRLGLDGGGRLSADQSQMSRPDAGLAAETLGLDTRLDRSLYLELDAQEPPIRGDWPQLIPPPDLGEGPHRSYAFQWFTFATIGLIGYGLVLRRISRGSEARGDVGQRQL
jgi:cytochrome oxidase assembly protein ShyY1